MTVPGLIRKAVHRLAKAMLAALEVLGLPPVPDEDSRGKEEGQ
jgi:hypothetical protein